MKKVMVTVLAVFFATLFNLSHAQVVVSNKAGWHKIGEVKADFKSENESISVVGADRFKSIKLKVTDAPIEIESVQVFYESGETEELSVKNQLKAGAETRIIDLKDGASKEIKKVVFVYRTAPNSKEEKAHVELYGLK